MMVFPEMLIPAAQEAGMSCPPNADDFKPEEFPHFHVFCVIQLGRAMEWTEHWDNAEALTAIPESEIKTLTLNDLLERGLRVLGR